MKPAFILFALTFLLVPALQLAAQQTTEEDPFADYSYLWEKPKKKKKKKQKTSGQPEKLINTDSIAQDSLAPAPSTAAPLFRTDTLQLPPAPAADTMVYPVTAPADTLLPAPADTTASPLTPWDEYEPEQKRDIAPLSNDFRAGLPEQESKGSFTAGITYTKIGNENFVGLLLSPEFKIWKIGLGLNVPVLYSLESQKVRTEVFEGGVGVARLVRYLRLGSQKRDPYYLRIGELTNAMIGFGSLVNNYTNTTSFEKRKVGLHYDFNVLGLAGIEGLYSDFDASSLNLLAVRPYVRPLAWTAIPVARTLEIGATLVRDNDQTRRPLSDSTFRVNTFTAERIGAFGVDAGINLLRIPFIQIDAFFSYSKLDVATQALTDSLTVLYTAEGSPREFQNGSGISSGVNFRFNFIANTLSTDVRIERLSYTSNYLPQLFDASYELNKDARLLALGNAPKMSGIYGSLTGHIINKVQLGGSLLLPDDVSDESPAILRLSADVERLADKVSLHGSYVKANLANLADAFRLDNNSLAKIRFIYHLNSFLAAGVDYYWAFAPTSDGSYKATHYVSPYFGVSVKF